MSRTSHEGARLELQRRRRAILETARRADAELEGLRSSGRAREFEEGAQKAAEAEMLGRLGDAQRGEIARIDEALKRLEAGIYGICRDCGEPIDGRRLDALPYASSCAECAARRESPPLTRS